MGYDRNVPSLSKAHCLVPGSSHSRKGDYRIRGHRERNQTAALCRLLGQRWPLPGTLREARQRLPGGEVVSEAERDRVRTHGAAEARVAVRKQAHPAVRKPRGSPATADALGPHSSDIS